jgi:hypothetical protein
MTQPRLVLPGSTVMVTRRTLRRHHLFRPDPAIRQLYLYTLAVCAREFGVLVHGVTLMSTHEHLVVTDAKWKVWSAETADERPNERHTVWADEDGFFHGRVDYWQLP